MFYLILPTYLFTYLVILLGYLFSLDVTYLDVWMWYAHRVGTAEPPEMLDASKVPPACKRVVSEKESDTSSLSHLNSM